MKAHLDETTHGGVGVGQGWKKRESERRENVTETEDKRGGEERERENDGGQTIGGNGRERKGTNMEMREKREST